MKLYIKQKAFQIKDEFTVKDEYGKDVYHVSGSFLEIPKNFSIYDMSGQKVCTIRRKHITFFPTFIIETTEKTITLTSKFAFFGMKFTIEDSDWILRGDFTLHEYELIRGNNPIMRISRHWFTWGDSYELDIQNEDDVLISLGIVIAVDYAILLASD